MPRGQGERGEVPFEYARVDLAAFGRLLHDLRVRAALSQNRLARLSQIDPAYVNRLERGVGAINHPSRLVVLRMWATLAEEGAADGTDRERLLVLAGLCPEVILGVGSWDAYLGRLMDVLSGREMR